MRKMINKTSENKALRKIHSKRHYIRPELVKKEKLVQVTQGFESRS